MVALQPLGDAHACFAAGAPDALALGVADADGAARIVSSSGGAPGISGVGAGISAQPARIPATAESTRVVRIDMPGS
jgi:hypothetical protein